ncbi:MAG TPA: LamG-like jellyroll fold domain-containing protein [Bacteroidota bacterium]|nr:LamG-like jellyroll fold domain-containing protein [Bacteroidota bacterium]
MKTATVFAVAALVAISFTTVSAAPQDTSLVLRFSRDGTAKDLSPYGNNGVVMGAVPTADRFGIPSRAYWFGGEGAKIVVHNSPSINPTDQLTITFWALVDSMTNNYLDVMCKGGTQIGYFENREYSVYLKQNYEANYFQLISSGDGQGQHEAFSYSYMPHQWLFFAGIIDRKSHLMDVYINGQEQTQSNLVDTYSSFNINEYDLWIGASSEGTFEHDSFRGALDDIRLYRRALTGAEILTLYTAPADTLPHMSLSPMRPFGKVEAEHNAVQVLSISNHGQTPLVVSHIRSSNQDFTISDSAVSVPASGSALILVAYAPSAVEVDTGSLTITSNDPDTPVLRIPLSGTGFVTGRAPVILTIADVPDDQGHQVRVLWHKSKNDGEGDTLHAAFYDVWRQVEVRPGAWDYVVSVPASGLDEYGFIAPTILDSNKIEGMHLTVFRVSTRFRETVEPAFSDPDSGYAVDNTMPSQVVGVLASMTGGLPVLRWGACQDADIDHYEVYSSHALPSSLYGMMLLGKATGPTYTDHSYQPGSPIYYRVTAVDRDGNVGMPSDVAAIQGVESAGESAAPISFGVEQNYPNPFNPKTVISGQWPVASVVRLAVYDVLGREVAVLANGRYPAGKYTFTFDGSHLSSGIYFYRLTAGSNTAVRKMTFLK